MKIQNIVLASNCRPWQDPFKVKFKEVHPLKVKNELSKSKRGLSNTICLYEMSLVLTCFKQNSFNEEVCKREIENFQNCCKKTINQNKMKNSDQRNNSPEEIHKLMKKYCLKILNTFLKFWLKMISQHQVKGFDECIKLLDTFKESEKIVLYFSGNKNNKGVNWCSDCQIAEPLVKDVVKECNTKNFIFIQVSVGSRDEWKNPECKFRTDERFKLTSIPTLMIYKSVQRLNDIECQDKDNIRLLLEDL